MVVGLSGSCPKLCSLFFEWFHFLNVRFSDLHCKYKHTGINHKYKHTREVHWEGRQRWYILGMQFWSGDLCKCLYYSLYTEREMLLPSLFTCVYTKGAHSLPFFVIYPLFHYCIQNDVTSHVSVFALASDLKKPRSILLYSCSESCTSKYSYNFVHILWSTATKAFFRPPFKYRTIWQLDTNLPFEYHTSLVFRW